MPAHTEPQFIFVDGRHADDASRRRLRRHVMRGKNAGRKLQRPSRRHASSTRHDSALAFSTPWLCCVTDGTVARVMGHGFSSLTMSPATLDVVDTFFTNVSARLYPVHLGLSMHDVRLAWFRYLFTSDVDYAAHMCTVSMMQACNEYFLGLGETPKAIYNISHTFSAVAQRLQGSDALADSTLAMVVALIAHEQIKNEHEAAAMHTKGLMRMVQLRGGLDKFDSVDSLTLVLKICKTDIVFSLQYGDPPMFFRDDMPRVLGVLASKGLTLHRPDPASLAVYSADLDDRLGDILRDIMTLCDLFNTELQRCNATLDCLLFLEIVVSLLYRLLGWRVLRVGGGDGGDGGSATSRTFHIGMVVFVMMMLVQRGSSRIIDYAPVTERVADLVRVRGVHDELRFWALFVGGIWHDDDPEGGWLLPELTRLADKLGLEAWAEARARLAKFPWLHALHDKPGRELWERLRACRSGHDRSGCSPYSNSKQRAF